jgi:hypothetical protein
MVLISSTSAKSIATFSVINLLASRRPPSADLQPRPYDPDSEADMLRLMKETPHAYPFSKTEFQEWAETIEEDASLVCNDPKGEEVRGVIVEKDGQFTIDKTRIRAEAIPCIIKAIRQNLARMPMSLNNWYMALLRYLELQEEKFQTR